MLSLVFCVTSGCSSSAESEALPGEPFACASSPISVAAGARIHIYDPSALEPKPWYINDHTFIRDHDGLWHLFGITHEEPANPLDEKTFAHATSPTLTSTSWKKEAPALVVDVALGEQLLWAPHVIESDGTYYMFYSAGGPHDAYQLRLATSPDLWTWTHRPDPLFSDGYDARDPFVRRIGDHWVMYYTATSAPAGGHHVVAFRTSDDLVHWSDRSVAFTHPSVGTAGGPMESPFVLETTGGYLLFSGPLNGYQNTAVYFSADPLHFDPAAVVGTIHSHAAEIVRDTDGTWYASHAGWGEHGVYLAPLSCGMQ